MLRLRVPVVVALIAAVLPITLASAAPTVTRLAGADRYATAVEISKSAYAAGVPVAFVATGTGFADALAGAPAAARRRGPVLLTERDRLPGATADELSRLRPAEIVVLGGTATVSDAVAAELDRHTDGPVTRLAGGDRFETAAAISRATFAVGPPVAYVANGGGFADALAAGPAAGAAGGPILLVSRDGVPSATVDELRRVQPRSIVILGGTAVVSDAVEAQLRQHAPSVGRSQGPDRYATSVAVSVNAFSPGVSVVYLATGATFPDALAGGPVAATAPGPILLVQPNCVPGVVNAEIDRLAPARLVLLGGTGAVGPGVEARTTCQVRTGPRTPTVVSPSSTPAFVDDAPDPALLRVGARYYAFTTGTTWGNRIGVLVSDAPNTGWRTSSGRQFGSTALPSIPSWQDPDTQWAPGVFAWNNRHVMFYAARVKTTGRWCLSVATSDAPAGPYSDTSSGPLVCQMDIGGSIDPHPFVDATGRPWIHWKNNDEFSPAVSKVWAAPLDAAGTKLAGAPVEVMAKDSQRYPWQTTVDNPQMVLAGGVHYLFYSAGYWADATYVVGYAVCDGPTGPCQAGAQPILGSYGSVAGPGGGTVMEDAAGRWWIGYHGWDSSCTNYSCGGKRRFYVASLEFR